MISIIILVFVSILVVGLIGIAWGANARRRAGQSGISNRSNPDTPNVERSPGPD